jgi:soluble lytic murein transglycosylase-like protein
MVEFVERIPFSETRGYVKQVLTGKSHYRVLSAAARNNP